MDLAAPLRWTMYGVFATLLTASTTTAALGRLRPQVDLAEIRVRVRSWWVMAAVFVVALAVDRRITWVFLTAIGVGAVLELARLIPSIVTPVAVVATVGVYAAAAHRPVLLVVVAAAPLVTAVELVRRGAVAGFVARVGATGLAVVVAGGLAHMASLLALPVSAARPVGGAGLLLMLVVVAQGGDVAQFITGRTFGRRRLSPTVSPNKTVAGFAGGVIVAALLGAGLGMLLAGMAAWHGAALGGAVAVAGTMGDLIVSAIKRDVGAKDAGSLIPGHGGLLDRVDSLVVAAPVFMVLVA